MTSGQENENDYNAEDFDENVVNSIKTIKVGFFSLHLVFGVTITFGIFKKNNNNFDIVGK